MRPGFNATRRNRNIGTDKQGHGQNNRMRVADPWSASGPFWAQLGRYRLIRRMCGGRELAFFVENTREDCVHACTVADIVRILKQIPDQDYTTLAAIVLRQPKRKEEILHPVWGRLGYWSNVGRPQDGAASGPVVILEALAPFRVWWRKKSVDPAEAAELERLTADGHVMIPERSRIRFESTLEATRATQLYRTLPHEIGHLLDFATRVPEPDEAKGISVDRYCELAERYWQRPAKEKEAFAHRYADEFRTRLNASCCIPFPRIETWDSDGLRSCDFSWPPHNQTSPRDPATE